VAKAEQELERIREEAKAARMASDAKQGQLRDSEEKVKKLQDQLNTASSNREYDALKDQIQAAEMTNSVLADEILEGMESLDGFKSKIEEANAALEKAQADKKAAEAKFAEEEPSIRGDLANVEARLAEAEAHLVEPFTTVYRRAVKSLGEDALSSVEGEFCSNCNQKVPLNQINLLLAAELKEPTLCKSCACILYAPEDWLQKK
jgi:predicted  nucleic acid-binding Zn-ribbon protein